MNKETVDIIRKFIADRDWDKFHSPGNLAKSISIEANELLECFQWSDTDYDPEHEKESLDVVRRAKMVKNAAKYPIEKVKGNAVKYDQL